MTTDEPLPRALEILWRDSPPARRTRGLSRERIVTTAIELVEAEGLSALSIAPDPPPTPDDPLDWRAALSDWAAGLWDVYHRHPWVLQTAAAGPPVDPGQLAWLDSGLAALAATSLTERDKLAAVMAILHYVRGAAALDIEAAVEGPDYPALLRRLLAGDRFPALAAAVAAGVFDAADNDHLAEFRSGLGQLLDGIAAKIA